VLPELSRRGVQVDAVTDQTSAHDPLNGYVPAGMTLAEAEELRRRDPKSYVEQSMQSMARHVEAMLRLKRAGAITFDYGNNIRKMAFDTGVLDGDYILSAEAFNQYGVSGPGRQESSD